MSRTILPGHQYKPPLHQSSQAGGRCPAAGRVHAGRREADGNTITVLHNTNTQHRIRLQGIDAPERKQAFGNASRKHLATLVAGKEVTVEWAKRGRYGRIVGFVIVDRQDVNLAQVKAGMAWFYRYYQKELSAENRKLYAQAEDEARANKKGLWQDKNPMPP